MRPAMPKRYEMTDARRCRMTAVEVLRAERKDPERYAALAAAGGEMEEPDEPPCADEFLVGAAGSRGGFKRRRRFFTAVRWAGNQMRMALGKPA